MALVLALTAAGAGAQGTDSGGQTASQAGLRVTGLLPLGELPERVDPTKQRASQLVARIAPGESVAVEGAVASASPISQRRVALRLEGLPPGITVSDPPGSSVACESGPGTTTCTFDRGASMATLDSSYSLDAVVTSTGGEYRATRAGLEKYLEPKRRAPTRAELHVSGRGIGYTKSAYAYLFRRASVRLGGG